MTLPLHVPPALYTDPVLDLFAGPGGWDEGAAMIGVTNTYGLEFEKNACATAEAAGHARAHEDIAALDPTDYRPAVGLIASPPCQAWSRAGKQLGYLDKAACFDLVHAYAAGNATSHTDLDHEWHDPRSHLVAEPMRWAVALEPEWIVLEEVPAVKDLWQAYALELGFRGYSVWTGILNAADYGVPQTRKRAILIASRTRLVGEPRRTHDIAGHDTSPTFEHMRWQTMAQALGWDTSDLAGFPRRSDGRDEVVIDGNAYRARDLFPAAGPAQTVTEKARSWVRLEPPVAMGDVRQKNGTVRSVDEPAPTLTSSMDNGNFRWVHERPATTVVGSFRPDVIAGPGYRKAGDGPRQNAPGSVRVEVWEAGVLQSFRPDYPWTGAKTRQYQQVGNAVPPRLAAHVIAEAVGLERTTMLANLDAYYARSAALIAVSA